MARLEDFLPHLLLDFLKPCFVALTLASQSRLFFFLKPLCIFLLNLCHLQSRGTVSRGLCLHHMANALSAQTPLLAEFPFAVVVGYARGAFVPAQSGTGEWQARTTTRQVEKRTISSIVAPGPEVDAREPLDTENLPEPGDLGPRTESAVSGLDRSSLTKATTSAHQSCNVNRCRDAKATGTAHLCAVSHSDQT